MAFGITETEKRKFHHRKNLTFLEDVDIEKYSYLAWVLQVKK